MLVLTRKKNESIMIGPNIKINIIQCENGMVKLGIDAPQNIKIYREEIFDEIKKENERANLIPADTINQLKNI